MGTLWQDIRFGFRFLIKQPLFTAVAAVSVALGIGLNTAIFTLVGTILLSPLPFRDAGRILALYSIPPGHPNQFNGANIPDFFAWKERARSFEEIGVMTNTAADFGAEENGSSAERIAGEYATPGVPRLLGVQPLMGRIFTDDEDQVDHPLTVMLISHRLWIRRFGGDPDILRRKVLVNGQNVSVIGVLRPDFRILDESADWLAPIPLNHFQLRGSARFAQVLAKLKRDVSIQQAQADLDAISIQLAEQFPERNSDHGKPWMVRMTPMRDAIVGPLNRPLLLLQGAVGFVLLIACANVAALLLARGSARANEVAIRSALGAGRGRIFRQFLTETMLLSLGSGALGIALGWAGIRFLVAMAPPWLPRLNAIAMDWRVLLFSLALSIVTGILFGTLPAAQGARSSEVETLKDGSRAGTSGKARSRIRAVLAAAQLALALVLLIGAGLLIRSFLKLQSADLGCDPHGVLTFGYRFAEKQFGKPVGTHHGIPLWEISAIPSQQFRILFDRLRSLPGVQSAAGIVYPPLTGNYPMPFTIDGRTTANADDLSADFFPVTENFFATMKIKLLRGRDFNAHDTAKSPWVAIVNETMARRFFSGENPIGRHIQVDLAPEDQPREVIAVVADIPASHPQNRQEAAIFIPYQQASNHITGPNTGLLVQMTYLLRTNGDPMSAVPAVRQVVGDLDRNHPLIDPRTEDSYLAEQSQYSRYYSLLLGVFAAIATGLAALGIHGVMAYTVEQRTREIGIRIALGAAPWDVLKLVSRQALGVTAAGVAAGIAGAAVLARYISSEIWEVKAADPGTFAAVALLLIAIAFFACLVPARRATQTDSITALRYE